MSVSMALDNLSLLWMELPLSPLSGLLLEVPLHSHGLCTLHFPKAFSSSLLATKIPCSAIRGPDLGFTVLRLDVIFYPGWLLTGIFTLYLLGLRLIYIMIFSARTFLEVVDIRL